MPYIKEIHIPSVTHIGHLDQTEEYMAPSHDGPALSVSTCPETWQSMIGSNAPHVKLFNSTALWVDAFSFTPDCMDEIARWSVKSGYMNREKCFTASWEDPDTGKLVDNIFASESEARDASGPEGLIFDLDGYRMSPRALKRLGRWHNPLDWYGATLILYTREIIIPKRPLTVGIWWREAVDPLTGSAPRGQLMPEGLKGFEVEDRAGDMIPFSEAFPNYRKIGAREISLIYG